ncbi:MAG: nucleotidyl transferase AbiEii/AbiGii toxin family protein [Rhodospirillales bacterium]
MPEPFFSLDEEKRRAVLEKSVRVLRRPGQILEKDVWVVWTLQTLFEAPFGEHLVFKGGTSLSKAHKIIRRFSEDVDITVNIRAMIPELIEKAGGAMPPSRSQAKKWSDEVRKRRLPAWIDETAAPFIKDRLAAAGLTAAVSAPADSEGVVLIKYERIFEGVEYVPPHIKLEFGARSTGEPFELHDVTCDAAEAVEGVIFPEARPRVMKAERTFWEKATAVHVYCMQGDFGGGERYARHWHDLVCLDDAGAAARAFADRTLAAEVAAHKSWFFAEKDKDGGTIDYRAAVNGGLRLVPKGDALENLAHDYAKMTDSGMFLDEPGAFDVLMERCAALEIRANQK